MKRRWVRVAPTPADDVRSALAAGILAAGVGVATFYVVRLFLARDPIGDVQSRDVEKARARPDEGS